MTRFALLFQLLAPAISIAQEVDVSLNHRSSELHYPAIEFLTSGESWELPGIPDNETLPAETARTKVLRVVVYRSEANQDVVVETVAFGLEGCCASIVRRDTVDMEAFAGRFGFKGGINGFVFSTWSSPRSFRFNYQGDSFHALVSGNGRIRIERGIEAGDPVKSRRSNPSIPTAL